MKKDEHRKGGESIVKRILMVLTVAFVIGAIVMVMAIPAFAKGPGSAGTNPSGAAASGLTTANGAYTSQPHERHFP